MIDVPIAGDGTNDASYAALDELRDELIPATLGGVPGADANVTGFTAGSEDFNELMAEPGADRVRVRARDGVRCSCW